MQTDSAGRFVAESPVDASGVVKARRQGYADAVLLAPLRAGENAPVDLWLSPLGANGQVGPAGGTVVVPGSPAQVTLPAAALVDGVTGQAFTGTADVLVTPIHPGRRPAAMPGSYQARAGTGSVTIESFGALHVELRAADSGRPLQLGAGKTAVIRIPLASRSPTPPATLPLYHLDETSGLWVEEGSATLVGRGEEAYYEGRVSHFSYWNADRPTETVYVEGCVRLEDGRVPESAVVSSEGVDYSGRAVALPDGEGRFRVPVRKGGQASLSADSSLLRAGPLAVVPSNTDISLPECLVLQEVAQAPVIVRQPTEVKVTAGERALLSVLVEGRDLRYEWRRNGTLLPGETAPVLLQPNVQASDSGAQYSVAVSNAYGRVTSTPILLTVDATPPPPPPAARADLMRLVYASFDTWFLAFAPAQLTDMEMTMLLPPATVCRSGKVLQAVFDGRDVGGGEPIAADVQHRIDASFESCDVTEGLFLDGRAMAEFRYTRAPGSVAVTGSTAMTQLSLASQAVQGEGRFGYVARIDTSTGVATEVAMTPASGAVLTSRKSGLSAVYAGGGTNLTVTSTSMIYHAKDLAFDVQGRRYVATGELRHGAEMGGALLLTSEGKQIGRLIVSGGVVAIEIDGQVQPL
ncbi:immunoglobulin domain-containing protein [Aquabacterium sp. A7-Y]|uniref:immunoglobulin domain-containing protein n=1 Tax=Aquabacterium sp. A7-Y TaxID=1349605 RepID=UPI00223E7A96|nr:hypothetical protein [Aquabacterium sp. A7-Y]MCW7537967.1 immunoglobulin domain-containing protein [Aquabacterium sp. A7-Y]